ncbi:MAG TPA: helix-turn-helix domain-containing protein [Candidatus Baltobacteraceae bacterium]|nr:helix-turn-helix domain-containing protein [Candidatus Baltobacteraceae bacterium]
MSPRPYQAGERRLAATEATRAKIVAAARELLSDRKAATFSMEAVAERADVARMTVYYQFKSKGKLLEALFDDIAARADMRQMRKVFQEPVPSKAIGVLIGVFCHLWESQRFLVRRLAALATLDEEIDEALTERRSWRREGLEKLLAPIRKGSKLDETVDLLFALTTFETYDVLRERYSAKKVESLLCNASMRFLSDG